jgi:chemotaxis protein MotB
MAEVQQEQEQKEKPLKPEEIVEYEISAFDVMFTSLGMIMLAFFILMNAFCVLDPAKERAVIGSLLGSFGVLPSGYGTSEEGTVTPQVEEISLSEEVVLFAAFEAFLEEQKLDKEDVEVFVDEEGRQRIRFSEKFLFGLGSIRFHPRVMPVLDRLAIIFRKMNRRVEVEGHTDSRQSTTSNWYLSAQRAAMVLRYFEEAGLVPIHKLTAVGLGSTRPRSNNSRDSINRRVEIVVN